MLNGEGTAAPEGKLSVIRKLLAKAEGAATPQEAETYNAKAAEMMARHGVDAALLAATGERPDVIGQRRVVMSDPYSAEKASLAGWIAVALRCRSVRHLGARRGQVAAVTLFGFESDLERIEILYTSLLLQATREVTRQRPQWRGESVPAYRRTWLLGFASEVHKRLEAAEHAAAAERDHSHPESGQPAEKSAALVLTDRRDVVERAYRQAFPNLRTAKRRTLLGSGYGAGQEAGRRADLGQRQRVTAATRRSLPQA